MMSQSTHRVRAKEKFKAAAEHLQNSIPKEIHVSLSQIKFPDLNDIDGVDVKASELEGVLERVLEIRIQSGTAKGGVWKKIRGVVVGWFRASYPFATFC